MFWDVLGSVFDEVEAETGELEDWDVVESLGRVGRVGGVFGCGFGYADNEFSLCLEVEESFAYLGAHPKGAYVSVMVFVDEETSFRLLEETSRFYYTYDCLLYSIAIEVGGC